VLACVTKSVRERISAALLKWWRSRGSGRAPVLATRTRRHVHNLVLRTPIKAPRANAICERLVGSVRRECLDHILLISETHLRRVLREYVRYFNRSRPHQGINQRVPDRESSPEVSAGATEEIVSSPVLGGLHHEYRRAA